MMLDPASTEAATRTSTASFWDVLGQPTYVCAPMVWQSERAFRVLCRQHGVGLAYSPMINAHCLIGERTPTMEGAYDTLDAVLHDITHADRPIIAQFCATTPEARCSFSDRGC
jgi:tRNA-dihydrouridine synthase